nr:pre-toxin TG domain-containing protein [Bacillus pakistanensis]
MTILPVTTSAEIQPWKGNPWEGNPWEGDPWEGSTFEGEEEKVEWVEKEATDELDPEVLEKLKEEGLGKEEIEKIKNIENLESIKYTDPELWEFLTNGNEIENYFKRIGIGLKDTFIGLWEGTKEGTSNAWDYVSSGEMWSDTKGMASESFRYFTSGEVFDDFKSQVHYHLSGQSWEDLKGGLSSAWNYTSNIGSYLFSKQSVSDLYGYFTSGEVLMDYAEDFEAFATGVDPESQQKISGGARVLAAGSILFKPLKAFKKLDEIGEAAEDTGDIVKKDRGDEKKDNKGTVNIPNNFADKQKLDSHYEKHGQEFKGEYKNADEYLNGARDVIKNGIKVEYSYKGEIRTGYVKFMGNNRDGKAKFEFVGTNNNGEITTYHTQSGKKLWKTINGKNIPVINPVEN